MAFHESSAAMVHADVLVLGRLAQRDRLCEPSGNAVDAVHSGLRGRGPQSDAGDQDNQGHGTGRLGYRRSASPSVTDVLLGQVYVRAELGHPSWSIAAVRCPRSASGSYRRGCLAAYADIFTARGSVAYPRSQRFALVRVMSIEQLVDLVAEVKDRSPSLAGEAERVDEDVTVAVERQLAGHG